MGPGRQVKCKHLAEVGGFLNSINLRKYSSLPRVRKRLTRFWTASCVAIVL